jgi:multiple sugar transport system substrate-binding protein
MTRGEISKLKLWITPFGGLDTNNLIQKEISVFEKDNPSIKVDLLIMPWSQAWDMIVSALKSKQLPDVFEIGNTWTKTLTAINALADITKSAESENLKQRFHPAVWATCTVENLNTDYTFALPWSADARMLFYRKDYFKKIGLSAKDISTWGSFRHTCEIISKRKNGAKFIGALGVGDNKDQGLVHDVAPWIWNGGGDILAEDGKNANFNSNESMRGVDFYFNLINDGYAPIFGRKVPIYPAYNFFVLHEYAMCITSSFTASAFLRGFFDKQESESVNKMKRNFGVSFLPAGPRGRHSFLGGTNLAISATTPHREEAWKLLKILTSEEFQIRQNVLIGTLHSALGAFNELYDVSTEERKVLTETYRNLGRSYKQVDHWASIELIVAGLFGKYIDTIKTKRFNLAFAKREADKFAKQVDYIISL